MRKAISLVEVLVVMVIIIVISGIVFPVFSRAREKAKTTVCVSNLSQIYRAFKLYEADYDEYPCWQPSHRSVKQYAGGVTLHCPVAQAKYTRGGSDYVAGAFIPALTIPDRMHDLFMECRTIRAGDIPLLMDQNHATLEQAYRQGESYFFVARDNGSVSRVLDRRQDASLNRWTWPCNAELGFLNY